MELTASSHLSSGSFVTSIRFAPPHFYRREVFGSNGKVKEIAILNDKEEWIYRRDTKKYWKMPPTAPLDNKKELNTLKANYDVSSPKASHAAGRRAFKIKLFSKENHSLSRI
jgi:outer membrane lipoprotein-sorting protein